MVRWSIVAVVGIAVVTLSWGQQTPKKYVLIEEFTSATCPPCVQASEKLNSVVRIDQGLISVRYHMNWPAPGDPFNVANPSENQVRRQYYNVTGIPFAAVMGTWQGHPLDANFDAAIAQQRGRPVRLQISIQEDRQGAPNIGVQIRIRNVSSQPITLTGHVLHVAVVNRRVEIPDLPQRLQGSNGETVFYDAMMKMLPDANGTSLSGTIAPGQEQTFGPFVYRLGTGELWPAGQDYVIAFVQNVSTKEVIDAGTNLEDKLTLVTVQLTAPTPQFGFIPRSGSVTRTLTLRNTSTQAFAFRLEIDPNNSVLMRSWGWNATVTPDSVSLAPGASAQFTVQVSAPADAGYARLTLKPVLLSKAEGRILELRDTNVVVGLLSENTKYVLYYGIVPWFTAPYLTIARALPQLQNDVAFLPLLPEDMAAFPVENFQLAVFPLYDYPLKTPAGELDHIYNAIQRALQGNTRVWLISLAGMYWAFDPNSQYRTAQAQSFYTNTLGLQYTRLQQRYSGNTLVSFPITGVANDPVGDGFSATANTSVSAGYNLYTDIFSLRSGSSAQPSFYYDNTPTSLAGVRLELANGNRLVYTSFGPEAIASTAVRQDLWNRVVTWLLGTAQGRPRIALSTYALRFDTVDVNTTRSLSLEVSNVGEAELRITNIQLSGVDAAAFNVPDADVVPIVLQPGEATQLEVQFRPTRAGEHSAVLTLFSNDPLEEQGTIVPLYGVGRSSTSVAEKGSLPVRLSPIPAQDFVQLSLPEGMPSPVWVEIHDMQGRRWLQQQLPVSSGTVRLSVGDLVSGTYTLLLVAGDQVFRVPLLITR